MIIESNIFVNNLEEIKNNNFRYGCVIPTFERQEYVTDTMLSISESFITKETIFIVIDDCSENDIVIPEVFYKRKFNYIRIKKNKNLGVANSLAIGFDILNLLGCEYFINLDSDVEVSKNWLISLHKTFDSFNNKKCIVTGFNGINHKIIKKTNYFNIKESIGGINLFFHRDIYNIIRNSLTEYESPLNFDDILNNEECYGKNPKIHPIYNGWDWSLNTICNNSQISFVSSPKSVIQHIGKFGLTSSTKSNPNFFEISLDFESDKKQLCFVFPEGEEQCGGWIVQDNILNILNSGTNYNTFKIKNSEVDDFIKKNENSKDKFIIIVFWGPLVDEQIFKFVNWKIVYWAHSCGYQFKNLNQNIPIIAVSKYTLQYYGTNFNNPVFLLYSPIEIKYSKLQKDIDILVQKRKCSKYVLDKLIPKIQIDKNLNILVIDKWMGERQDFINLLTRSKIYIYDSKDYWNSHNLSEGFGIPPIEALMAECIVFSSLNNSLSDILEPLVNCFQITGNIDYDYKNIEMSVNNYNKIKDELMFKDIEKFTTKSFLSKFDTIIKHIENNI